MTGIEMSDTRFDKSQPPVAKTACGGKLKDPVGYPGALYHSEQVYFCTHACLHAFERNPDAFMEGEIDHPIDKE